MAAIYSVYTSPQHAPIPGHLPTLIVTPHGQPSQILYTYLHTEENRVNYLLTPSPQGDLCVAKLFPPSIRPGNNGSTSSLPTLGSGSKPNATGGAKVANVVRCEASRDLRWTIENTGVMSPIYKIINQDDTPLYQISKPNPNADFWTMFYFKYAGHQIPPKRIEFGKVSKNPPEKGGGTRISITGRTDDEKQVWQTLGVGNEDCVEWVVSCAVLNLLDDEILRHAEKKQQMPNPNAPAATAPSPASTRPARGIASTAASIGVPPAQNLAATYRNNPALASRSAPMNSNPVPPPGQSGYVRGQPGAPQQMMRPPQQQGGYDPRSLRGPPPQQNMPPGRNGLMRSAPPAGTSGRRF